MIREGAATPDVPVGTSNGKSEGAAFLGGNLKTLKEFVMLRRFGSPALTVSIILVGASSTLAQSPLYVPGQVDQVMDAGYAVEQATAVEQMNPDQASVVAESGNATHEYDPYSDFHERRSRGWRWHERANNAGDCGDCDFECANCFSRFDVEKRLFFSYAHGNAHKTATNVAYGDDHSGQVGIEVLPWVITDNDVRFTRFGFTTMFNYSNYEGNRRASLLSGQTGNLLSIDDGKTYSFILGPTWRTDFQIGRLRLSPNATTGITFDWTTVTEIAPQPGPSKRIDFFKYAGFDAGAYIRMMLDFPITEQLNIGVGGEFKYVPSDVMMREDTDARKHLGVVVSISHEF